MTLINVRLDWYLLWFMPKKHSDCLEFYEFQEGILFQKRVLKVFYTPLSCDIKSCFGVSNILWWFHPKDLSRLCHCGLCYTPASYPRRATNFATGCHFLLTNFCFSLEEDVDKVWSKKNKVIDTTSAPIGTEKNFATHSRDQSFPLSGEMLPFQIIYIDKDHWKLQVALD